MIRSLLLKLGMLAVMLAAVFWIGWQAPDLPPAPAGPVADPAASPAEPPRQEPILAKAGMPSGEKHVGGAAPRGLLDLNSATADELESLPGIGAVLAQRVIAYRQSVGRFLAVEELREVKGIGAKTLDRIRPLVTVARGERNGKTEKRTS